VHLIALKGVKNLVEPNSLFKSHERVKFPFKNYPIGKKGYQKPRENSEYIQPIGKKVQNS